ncbi:MAG: response regulator [Chloroflexi bacterium]|nr:response regulator [Chloroflexota bacterium]
MLRSPDDLLRENESLRERLSRLSEASLRINESLDFEQVLQGVLDSARSLTGARYGVMTLLDDEGLPQDFLSSGLTPEESEVVWLMPEGLRVFQALTGLSEPMRVPDLTEHMRGLGFSDFTIPLPVGVLSALAAPMFHRGARVGHVFVGQKDDGGEEFSLADQETLVMFASQAALVIANARVHREERQARADLETLVNTSPVGVVVFDAKTGVAASLNREARRIFSSLTAPDQPAEQLLEVLTFRRADGREISLQEFTLAQALSTGETVRAEEIVVRVPDGRSVTALMNATPIRSDEGEVESYVVTMQDMGPLEEQERLRAEFLAMVSHELRTPLTSIKGSAATLLDTAPDLDPTEMRQFFRIIVEQADRMRELIGDLLDVARIETGALPVSPEPADVALLVDRARSTFLTGGGRHNLEIDLAPDLPLVMADGRRIVQVIGNLLANAARHSPQSSTIRVGAVSRGLHVEISVADDGRGIAGERLPQLFRKFAASVSEDDTGLGLAICKGIVEAHGGRIWAQSDGPGMGACFSFSIPAIEESTAVLTTPSNRWRRESADGECILVIDDDPQLLRYVRLALSEAGYRPVVSTDPGEALPLVQEHRPHLALLDLLLPGSDDIELMSDILRVADLPVVFISAYGADHVVARAFDAGAADYIVKPFSPTELLARIRAALRRRMQPYQHGPPEPYVLGDLTVDYAERKVSVAGRPVHLTPTEYNLLFELSVNAGRVVTHNQLLYRGWNPEKPGDVRTLRTHLKKLRRKLGDDAASPQYIFAEPRVGYRMPKP